MKIDQDTTKPIPKRPGLDFFRLQMGTNSIVLTLAFITLATVAYRADVLNWSYLKGLDQDLSFFISLFSIILGSGFYSYWRLGKQSVYTLHLLRTKLLTNDVNVIVVWKDFAFGISRQEKIKSIELPSSVRALLCFGIIYSLMLLTLDNSGFNDLQQLPDNLAASQSEFCQDEKDEIADAPPIEGCELIVRAYKLGYAKNLGICEPKKTEPGKMEICEKRRVDEPYLHYMYRLIHKFYERMSGLIENNKAKQVADKFELQLQQIEALKDYQTYAMSAAPRAAHHIWTNLSYPNHIIIQKYREIFNPNYCIEKFQNQTNTVLLDEDDERKRSKLLEHVYGQLLFNPRNEITVGFCKEYTIHWNSAQDTCERLVKNPSAVLQEERILDEVELVLRRHDIANSIIDLDEQIQEIEKTPNKTLDEKIGNRILSVKDEQGTTAKKTAKSNIIKSKIAKARQQLRPKNEIVSFQCFMQTHESNKHMSDKRDYERQTRESIARFQKTKFIVRTRYFPEITGIGESRIAMYHEFAKVLDSRFHYSKLTSRSEIDIEGANVDAINSDGLLEEPSYLLARLEVLKNVDIYLGNNWVLERDDLLKVYPYHVHLKNYAKRFRLIYKEKRGRL